MPPLYTNKFRVSRYFFIYFQRTGLAEYLPFRRHAANLQFSAKDLLMTASD